MLLRSILASLLVVSSVFAAVVDVDDFNPATEPVAQPNYEELEDPLPLTNAERFQRGLGPLPPTLSRRGPIQAPGHARPPYIPSQPSPPAPSPSLVAAPPVKFKGHVQVKNAKTGQVLGYVSSALNRYGEFGIIPANRYRGTGALSVAASVPRSQASHGTFSLQATNGSPRNLPFLGAVAAQSAPKGTLTRGKSSYAYLALTGQTKAGLGPSQVANSFNAHTHLRQTGESAIWSIDQISQQLSATWVNPDRTSHATTIFYYPSQNTLVISTDPVGFERAFRNAVPVHLTITS